MPPIRRDFLIERAGRRCEYCHFPEAWLSLGLYLDHIVARQHGGSDEEDNLAMSCEHCNACKGPNIASIDPLTSERVWLFNPRIHAWDEHFEISEDQISGKTPMGRATARLLDMNSPNNTVFRRMLRLLEINIEA
jgi:hypothetical protein